jgi:PAS domain S-box-containing protein
MRLLIVDDHELVRRGVRSLLADQTDWDVCGEAVDGQDALEKARDLRPDLIVMDVSMPRLNGLEATRQMRSIFPNCEVLLLSQHENPEVARQALKAGARGYVVKSSISRDLISAIAKASRHEYFFDPAILDQTPSTHTEIQQILQRSSAFEKALRESEEHLQLVTRSMAASVTRCSKDFRYVWVNQGYADWLRKRPEQIIGQRIEDVIGTKAFESLHPYFEQVLSGKTVSYEEEVTLQSVGPRWVSAVYTPTLDSAGVADGWVAAVTDITERKLTHNALTTGTRQHKALFHLADDLHRAQTLDDVYHAALNAMLDALQCDRASILLSDASGVMHFQSWRGLSSQYRHAVDGHRAWKPDERNPQPVCIGNINSADLNDSVKIIIRREGISALAFIPLVSRGKLIGKFMTYFNDPHPFTGAEIDLSLTIARQLAFAIDRKRSDKALQESKAQIEAEAHALSKLNACSSRLWQMPSLHEGLQEMLSATIELLGAGKGNVQLLDLQHGVLTIDAQQGFQQDFLEFFREVSATDDTACGRALRTGRRIVIEDVEKDALFAPFREVARAAGFRAVTSTPLIGKDGAPLGILSTHFAMPHRPSDQELHRLDLYVRQAADFIERWRTEESLRNLSQILDVKVRARTMELEEKNADLSKQSEQVRELSHDLLKTQDEERRRIARELHDSAGQTLAAIGMRLHQAVQDAARVSPPIAERLEEVQSMVQQLNREIRTTSYLLHPPLLDESGLSSALNWYVQGLSERSSIAITLEISEQIRRLPSNMELAIFRLVQECLTNIHRHSGSNTASIRIRMEAGNVRLEISDEGKGIAPERLKEIQSAGSGMGIRGMQERLHHFGGRVSIESDASGTRVLATIPVPKDARSAEQETLQAAV